MPPPPSIHSLTHSTDSDFTSFPLYNINTAIASMSQASKPATIPNTSYPHIVEIIISYCDYQTLLRFRATCHSLKALAHETLYDGSLLIEVYGSFIDRRSLFPDYEVDYPHYPASWAPKSPTVVMRSGVVGDGLGVLPFHTEEDWTWACARSNAVEIDSAALAASSCLAPMRRFITRKARSRHPQGVAQDRQPTCPKHC